MFVKIQLNLKRKNILIFKSLRTLRKPLANLAVKLFFQI